MNRRQNSPARILTTAPKPWTPVVIRACGDEPEIQTLSADEFAAEFVSWCVDAGETGPTDWPRLAILAAEFAEFADIVPVTDMALSKALRRMGLRSTQRYLKPTDRGYAAAQRRGSKRPRVAVLTLPEAQQAGLAVAA